MIDKVLTIMTVDEISKTTCDVFEIVAGAKYLAVWTSASNNCPTIHTEELGSADAVRDYAKTFINKLTKFWKVEGKGEFEDMTAGSF